MTISPARRSAFEILRRVELEQAFASILLAGLDRSLRDDDRALCHELVMGVLRRRLWLDRVVEHFAKRKIERLDLAVRLALELGLYQLQFLSRIPSSAAVNESVNLVRAAGVKSAATFVNAVLRRATREPEYDPATVITDPVERLSVESSHPQWLIDRWARAFGFAEAGALAHAHNQAPPVAFRLTARAMRGNHDVQGRLKASGAFLAPSAVTPDSWRINVASETGDQQFRTSALIRTLVREGLIYLQDEASQLVAHLLKAERGHRVLDVAAAPGSKATLVSMLSTGAQVIAADFHQHRVRTMRELARVQDAQLQVLVHDATKPLPFPAGTFDRVLLDAPCSGTGTLRRNPEIRWRLDPGDIGALSLQQQVMLANAAALVRPGGRIIYSTCSIEVEENEDVVRAFLADTHDFGGIKLEAPEDIQTGGGALRTWPHRQGTEGFFIAGFERKK